jgi:hypothetical protein
MWRTGQARENEQDNSSSSGEDQPISDIVKEHVRECVDQTRDLAPTPRLFAEYLKQTYREVCAPNNQHTHQSRPNKLQCIQCLLDTTSDPPIDRSIDWFVGWFVGWLVGAPDSFEQVYVHSGILGMLLGGTCSCRDAVDSVTLARCVSASR